MAADGQWTPQGQQQHDLQMAAGNEALRRTKALPDPREQNAIDLLSQVFTGQNQLGNQSSLLSQQGQQAGELAQLDAFLRNALMQNQGNSIARAQLAQAFAAIDPRMAMLLNDYIESLFGPGARITPEVASQVSSMQLPENVVRLNQPAAR
jgi:hypothetical protein